MTVSYFFEHYWPWSHVLHTLVIPFFLLRGGNISGYYNEKERGACIAVSFVSAIMGNIICFVVGDYNSVHPYTSAWSYLWLILPLGFTFLAFQDWLMSGGPKKAAESARFIGRQLNKVAYFAGKI